MRAFVRVRIRPWQGRGKIAIPSHLVGMTRVRSPWIALAGVAAVGSIVVLLRCEREPPPHRCARDPVCASEAFHRLAAAEDDARNVDGARLTSAIAKALDAGDCAGAREIWFLAYLPSPRNESNADVAEARLIAGRALEAACP